MSTTPVYCVNHPQTETLLRCIKCNKPVCIKCVVRTPVGLRCKECMNIQQAGFYNATPVDYVVAGIAGLIASVVGGAIAAAIGGFWFIMIFIAPAAGGAIAEVIRWSISRRRAKYLWVVACAAMIVGTVIGAGFLPLVAFMFSGRGVDLLSLLLALPVIALRAVFNIGFLIYVVLAVGTVYARLRS